MLPLTMPENPNPSPKMNPNESKWRAKETTMKTELISLINEIKSHKSPVQWPLSVSYHGSSTILTGANGRWVCGQFGSNHAKAEATCRELNLMAARCVFAPDSLSPQPEATAAASPRLNG